MVEKSVDKRVTFGTLLKAMQKNDFANDIACEMLEKVNQGKKLRTSLISEFVQEQNDNVISFTMSELFDLQDGRFKNLIGNMAYYKVRFIVDLCNCIDEVEALELISEYNATFA